MKAATSLFATKSLYSKEKPDTLDILCDQIKQNKVLPIISNNVTDDLLFGSHEALVENWAEQTEYPFADRDNFTRMSQYADITVRADQSEKDRRKNIDYIKTFYLNSFLKPQLLPRADEGLLEDIQEEYTEQKLMDMPFTAFAQTLQMPDVNDNKQDTLSILTELRLPIYVTTSYHGFMEVALEKAGRKPRVEISYWHPRLKGLPSNFSDGSYQPTPEEPLVYHLLGHEDHPESMVMTEDDYLDFLAGISEDWQWQEGIPGSIRQALSNSSLLLLGYNLWEWDFRVLLRGLIKRATNNKSPQSVSIQLREDKQERAYFQRYLEHEAGFEVYWENTTDLMEDIYNRWSALA